VFARCGRLDEIEVLAGALHQKTAGHGCSFRGEPEATDLAETCDKASDARLTSRLGTSIDDTMRIRRGSIHEFKGLEVPPVVLTDVDLSRGYHRDLLSLQASRATDQLLVLEQK
jgi:hypothetical protein